MKKGDKVKFLHLNPKGAYSGWVQISSLNVPYIVYSIGTFNFGNGEEKAITLDPGYGGWVPEDAVDTAKDALANARINGGKPIDSYYISTLLSAKNNVTSAEEALEKHKEKIAFLQGEKDLLNTDVEAES